MKIKRYIFLAYLPVLVTFVSCDKNNKINFLSIADDVKLGRQVDEQILSTPTEYPILPKATYPVAYGHMERIFNKILASDKVVYKSEFPWEVKIIHRDDVLNAFCTPGGFVYVYTGLIKYLESEDHLAGVIGHEIAHADLRHTSRQLTQQYGYDIMIKVVLGNDAGTLVKIASGLKDLSYSRSYESESDAKSVDYLAGTDYQCNGAAGFFEKLEADPNSSGPRPPQWLSTHPNPDNRIREINSKAQQVGCKTTALNPGTYLEFKNSLP